MGPARPLLSRLRDVDASGRDESRCLVWDAETGRHVYQPVVLSVNDRSGSVELDTAAIPDSVDRRYLTDAQLAILESTSGINSGDQDLSNLQPMSVVLSALAELVTAANKLPYFTGSGTAGLTNLSEFCRSFLDDEDAAAARVTLGLGNVVNADTSTTLNITDSAGKRFVTDLALAILDQTSGVNTGDQDLSGLLEKSQNLSDLLSVSSARENLGLGEAALLDIGTAAGTACAGDDSRLSDSRTPTAHAASHGSGGSDSLKLDELAAPSDVTTLNASTARHGLLRKLDNEATHYLDGQGNWSVPAGEVSFVELALRDIAISKNGGAPLDLLINAFADGFESTTGINSGTSSNYNTSESGVIKPSTSIGSRITGGIPSVQGSGTAANINDNNSATMISWTPGNIAGQPVANRIMAKLDFGTAISLRRIEVRRIAMGSSADLNTALFYSVDGATWIQAGTVFTVNTSAADVTRDMDISARYVALAMGANNYGGIAVTLAGLNAYGAVQNSMDVKLVGRSIADSPATVDVIAVVEEIDALVVNSDLLLSASRDGGANWTAGTAVKRTTVAGKQLWVCSGIDVSTQPAGSSLSVRMQSANSKAMKIHGIWARKAS